MAAISGMTRWGASCPLLDTRLLSNDQQTNNIGSHAGSNISGFNGAAGNYYKYQSNDSILLTSNNRMEYNEFIKVQAFNNKSGSNISS
ncbi:hypothetical protein MKW98_014433 [Papaver atlanticum]|uniref:Uncharacterized protein n=1 Tax=Papaver atlanticum TaxID=357466 RepID=A0AAD4S9P7_9MAGN|nr:hypothetical protein MKW98_014433 [Papaver atlanticum]